MACAVTPNLLWAFGALHLSQGQGPSPNVSHIRLSGKHAMVCDGYRFTYWWTGLRWFALFHDQLTKITERNETNNETRIPQQKGKNQGQGSQNLSLKIWTWELQLGMGSSPSIGQIGSPLEPKEFSTRGGTVRKSKRQACLLSRIKNMNLTAPTEYRLLTINRRDRLAAGAQSIFDTGRYGKKE